jgi:DNA-binding winged helix-turn-helix (wHTH) protein
VRRLLLQDRLILPELNSIVTNGASVHVEPKAMEVLLELACHPGEVLSKARLIQRVWGGVFVCEDVVTNAISLLRRALSDEPKVPFLIQTIPKRGYRLMVPLLREATAEAAVSTVPWTEAVGSPSPSWDISAARRTAHPISDLDQDLLRVRHLRHEETVASLQSACA